VSSEEQIVHHFFHVSKAWLWGECMARARLEMEDEAEAGDSDNSESTVAEWVGNRVHAEITGHIFRTPKRILYDSVTRTEREADRQVEAMVDLAWKLLKEHRLEIVEREVYMSIVANKGGHRYVLEGTTDMVVRDKDGHRFLLDLKTGARKPVNVWLQVGLYFWMWESTAKARKAEPVHGAGVFWIRRPKMGDEIEGRIHIHSEEDLLAQLRTVAKTSFRRMADNRLSYSPSMHGCACCLAKETCTASPYSW